MYYVRRAGTRRRGPEVRSSGERALPIASHSVGDVTDGVSSRNERTGRKSILYWSRPGRICSASCARVRAYVNPEPVLVRAHTDNRDRVRCRRNERRHLQFQRPESLSWARVSVCVPGPRRRADCYRGAKPRPERHERHEFAGRSAVDLSWISNVLLVLIGA